MIYINYLVWLCFNETLFMFIQKTDSGKDLTQRSSFLTPGLEDLVKGEKKASVDFLIRMIPMLV